jgi:hypothetical protein
VRGRKQLNKSRQSHGVKNREIFLYKKSKGGESNAIKNGLSIAEKYGRE